jgi:hypothetical protein
MAWDNPTKVLSFPAAGDLSGFQFYPVSLTTAGSITTISATATKPIGVLSDAPDAAGVMGAVIVEGVAKTVVYNGTLAPNDAIGVATTGIGAVTTTDNQWVVGDVLDVAGSGTDAGINVVIPVLVNVHRY